MGKLGNDVVWQRAQRAYAANDMRQAANLCEELVRRDRRNAGALAMLGQTFFARNELDQAASYLLKAVELRPREPTYHSVLGEIRTFQGRFNEAVTRYDRALRLRPDDPQAIAGKADAFEKSGQRDKARAVLRPFVEEGRETAQMMIMQARLDLHDGNDEAVVELVGRHLARPQVQGYIRWHLCFLIGQALERLRRYDESFAAYEAGNAAVPATFDAEEWKRRLGEIIDSFSLERFERVPRATHGSQLSVFIVGMPRSGSTLVETIIDAHPDAHGVGESPAMQEIVNDIALTIGSNLPFPDCIEDLDLNDVDMIARAYLDRVSPPDVEAKRLVDKYLANYRYLGLIAVLFPEARIIHCRRHPLDTCFSCYMHPFFPTIHPYATDLRALGAVYVTYERIMAHWRDVLRIPMLEVQYEELVSDPERVTREMIDYCGLDWDDRCLRYYEKGRTVTTASYNQVSRPIYTSSVRRYQGFEKHLAPLVEALAGVRA